MSRLEHRSFARRDTTSTRGIRCFYCHDDLISVSYQHCCCGLDLTNRYSNGGLDITWEDIINSDPIPPGLTVAEQKRVLGGEACKSKSIEACNVVHLITRDKRRWVQVCGAKLRMRISWTRSYGSVRVSSPSVTGHKMTPSQAIAGLGTAAERTAGEHQRVAARLTHQYVLELLI